MTRQSWIQRRQFDSELQVSGVGVGVDSEERLKVVREGVSKVPEGEARDKEGSVRCLREARDKDKDSDEGQEDSGVSCCLWTVGE